MTETLQGPSHHTLREELQEMVVKDLLGPAGGPEEEVDEARVSDRYLVGTLNSKRRHKCLGYYRIVLRTQANSPGIHSWDKADRGQSWEGQSPDELFCFFPLRPPGAD